MPAVIHHVSIDCRDPYTLAGFWSEVLGFPRSDDDEPGDPEVLLVTPEGHPGVLFLQVPEEKSIKNRLHFDLMPEDRSRDEEAARVTALGARQVDDRRRPDGSGWIVFADPEGNEFCIERSAAERAG